LEEIIEADSYIFHCAAFVSFRKEDKDTLLNINIEGTKNIVQICLDKKVKKLVHVSSIAALGRGLEGKETTEEDYWDGSGNASNYSKSKFESEREVWRGIAEGLNALIVNPSVIIGPGEWGKGSSQLIQTVWKGLKFYTSGTNGYVDVRDVSTIIVKLSQSEIENERFILSSENVDYKTFFGWIAQYLEVKSPPFYAGKFLSGISWRILKIWSLFSGKDPIITKETARSANQKYKYSNQKILEAIQFEFIPVSETIRFTCEKFLESNKHSQ
jgi:nucleoside-diphosphate-sugar epimerase